MSSQIIARYSFLPWLRQGISSQVTTTDNLADGTAGHAERAAIEVALIVNDTERVPNRVQIYGPGDITGLDARAVVRTDPKAWVTDFEPNYLPAVEFYDEDFPWRYTPARATVQHRLRPWISLVVLAEDEFARDATRREPLPAVKVERATELFPPATQTWAWAHVHVNRDLMPNAGDGSAQAVDNLEALLSENPDLAVSRLVCPRRLKANTAYYAFVIPTFETGRLAGLGAGVPATTDGLAPAWGNGQTDFPVYYEWFFKTGARGDFEQLVRLLEPRVLDERVGVRPMDVQEPGYEVPPVRVPPALGLEGALKTPQTASTPWPDPQAFQTAVAALVNLPEDLRESGATSDPVVAPPLYGRWHAAVKRLRAALNPLWIDRLNLDPRHRTVAGFGTLVVQTQQEELMDSAWRQVGRIEEANRQLKRAQLARAATSSLYVRHIATQDAEQALALAAPVLSRMLASPVTVKQKIAESRLPSAAVSRAFRRVARPRGPVARRLDPVAPRRAGQVITRLNGGEITAAPPKTVPDRQLSIEDTFQATAATQAAAQTFAPEPAQGSAQTTARSLAAERPAAQRRRRRPGLLLWLLLWLLLLILSVFAGVLPFLRGLVQALRRRLRRTGDEGATSDEGGAGEEGGTTLAPGGRTESVSAGVLTPEAVKNVAPRPEFVLTRPGEKPPRVVAGDRDSLEAENFRGAAIELHERFQFKPPGQPVERAPLELPDLRATVIKRLDPEVTIPARVLSTIDLPGYYLPPRTETDADPLQTIMAAPDFPQPMYEPLRDISSELLVPNLELIRQNTIALLQTNQPFIEAYMVGLNHEMSRELLWREYPTDQRGSYFRQFWDVRDAVPTGPAGTPAQATERLRDIKPIHTWPRAADLGDNNNRPQTSDAERLVLVIRGDLLKKYPTAVIYAVEAIWPTDPNITHRVPGTVEKYPLFKAKIEPDITFIGFDLTAEVAEGSPVPAANQPGWFFVIKERPGEPRFGLDEADAPASETADEWDDLSWGHLAATQSALDAMTNIDVAGALHHVQIDPAKNPDGVQWDRQSADMAHILYQAPVLIAVHADEMLD
ncbi:MAG TPA: hypothetical protein VGC87_11015 [Pyrinomonadaceae bacterium]|jgi:hypothetical protein